MCILYIYIYICTCVYIYIYIYAVICMCIYIYIERERDRERCIHLSEFSFRVDVHTVWNIVWLQSQWLQSACTLRLWFVTRSPPSRLSASVAKHGYRMCTFCVCTSAAALVLQVISAIDVSRLRVYMMCVYVYINIYIYIYIEREREICWYVCICTCICTCIHIYVYVMQSIPAGPLRA